MTWKLFHVCHIKVILIIFQLFIRKLDSTSGKAFVHENESTASSRSSSNQDTFRLASYYSDHMILQREPDSAVIWGYAELGADIAVLFKDVKYSTEAIAAPFSSEGVWRVTLDPQPPSGPFTIKVTSESSGVTEAIELQDVLFGDVWVCSGQSNMAFDVKSAFNGSEALIQSYQYSDVRVLSVGELESNTPLYDLQSVYRPWSRPSPDALGGENTFAFYYFSAVCWFFGRDLYDHLKYPIGLISTDWGGTPIEAWSAPAVLRDCNITKKVQGEGDGSELERRYARTKHLTKASLGNATIPKFVDSLSFVGGPQGGSVLWNAMIHPLLNMSIKGAIWYQGEDNAVHDPSTYNCLFPAMISDWRRQWYQSTGAAMSSQMPFGFVQLCNSEIPGNDNFTALRWHQTADFGYVPNPIMPHTFMAVAIDLPDLQSPLHPVHPRYKQDVSARLLLGARGVAYGEGYVTFQGPFPSSISYSTNPTSILVQFNNGTSSLQLNSLNGFDVCCAQSFGECPLQGNASWVPAPILGMYDKAEVQISVPCQEGAAPVGVRYIWADLPCQFKKCALYDANSHLPVPPFSLPVMTKMGRRLQLSETLD